ncbi:hypothetical protein DFH06DRAFT_1250548 [Mycena polygramma]|nr:hypothetical protein DFH06DRAFT_1250548 [Mycena polygramma]
MNPAQQYATDIMDQLRGWAHDWLEGLRGIRQQQATLNLPVPYPSHPLPVGFPIGVFSLSQRFEWVHEYRIYEPDYDEYRREQLRHTHSVDFVFQGRTNGPGSSVAWSVVDRAGAFFVIEPSRQSLTAFPGLFRSWNSAGRVRDCRSHLQRRGAPIPNRHRSRPGSHVDVVVGARADTSRQPRRRDTKCTSQRTGTPYAHLRTADLQPDCHSRTRKALGAIATARASSDFLSRRRGTGFNAMRTQVGIPPLGGVLLC